MSRFGIIPASVFDQALSPQDIALLALLSTYADKAGWCFPSYTTIGSKLERSKAWVSEHIGSLEAAGFLEISRPKRGKMKFRILYDSVQPSEQGVQPAERHLNSTINNNSTKAKKIKTTMPDDFTVTPEMIIWATKNRPDVNTETFTASFKLKTSAGEYKYIDWQKAWRTWLANERTPSNVSAFARKQAPDPTATVERFLSVAGKSTG